MAGITEQQRAALAGWRGRPKWLQADIAAALTALDEYEAELADIAARDFEAAWSNFLDCLDATRSGVRAVRPLQRARAALTLTEKD